MEQTEVAVARGARHRYVAVNATWPETTPPLTEAEARTAAKRLWRKFMGKRLTLPIRFTSGRRHTWIRRGVLWINIDCRAVFRPGWHDLVHSLSHLIANRRYEPGHSSAHTFLEREMASYVVSSGWLDGKLRRPERPKASLRDVRYAAVLKRLSSWEAKRKRAETAIMKLKRRKAYYEARSLG